jgi:hypothetical protein
LGELKGKKKSKDNKYESIIENEIKSRTRNGNRKEKEHHNKNRE